MYFFHGRNTHLVVFCLSAMEEIHIQLFYVFLPWKKYIKRPWESFHTFKNEPLFN